MMTAFVLGATGFVGREVVRQLCVRGVKTFAHVRPDSKQLAEWRARFGELGAEVDTTAWDAPAMAARFREVRPAQVYVLIGTTRSKAKADSVEGNIYEAVDLGLTKIAVEAARASETQPRIVYLSSVGADATARSAYLKARGQAEDVVKASGLPSVIARPSIITGEREDGRLGERTAAVVGDGLLAVAGVLGGKKLRARYKSTTPDVLASALIRLGEQPEHDIIVDGAALR
ncbi:MAG: NAD(P)H-binding protein [Deltaproteobacteria bacterium]|nr:NAD(P)H-binding protein [Deltaproteobacteria bacterium]